MISLQETLQDIAKAIVDSPDEVTVTCTEDDNTITLTLTVAPDDMGRVIGKQGRVAKAIRTVVRASANRNNQKIAVEID